MKKDKHSWSMKAASVLMTLALISSCFLGGTFSKYIVTNSASDKARVAKFGVKVETKDFENLFRDHYAAHDTTYKLIDADEKSYSVKNPDCQEIVSSKGAGEGDNLIAPGTYYEPGEGDPNYSIEGKPEVAVRVKTGAGINIKNMDKYMPIIFRVEKTSKNSDGISVPTIKYFYLKGVYSSNSTVKLNNEKSIKLSGETVINGSGENVPGVTATSERFISGTTSTKEVSYTCTECEGVTALQTQLVKEISSVNDYKPNTDLSGTNVDGCYISWYWPFEYSTRTTDQGGYEYNKVETGAQIYENDTGTYEGDANKAGVANNYDTADQSTKDTGLGDWAVGLDEELKKLDELAAASEKDYEAIKKSISAIYKFLNVDPPAEDINNGNYVDAIKDVKAAAAAKTPNISISFAVSIEQID